MIVHPKVKGFICTTAHPVGCSANVEEQVRLIRQRGLIQNAPRRVLVIGASTGYGLASRITAAFGGAASTIGVFFERPASEGRTASAGWYNTAAFQREADDAKLYARNVNGDAFSNAVKEKVIEVIKADLGQIDLLVYSLASPRRQHPETGTIHSSVLKPIGKSVTQSGVDTSREIVRDFTLAAASEAEIADTIAVMGGDDWRRWVRALSAAKVLAPEFKTTAYTYVGEKITRDIYWNGTIGAAKQDLDRTAVVLREAGFDAAVSVLKAVVTQSSAAIPIMPLYLALLFRLMKQERSHEGCIEQTYRLFVECLYSANPRRDDDARYRVDERELSEHIQQQVGSLWSEVTTENLHHTSDFEGFRAEFLKLFGFGVSEVDYERDVDVHMGIRNLVDLT